MADQVMTLSMTSKNFSLSYGLDTRATGLRLDLNDQALSRSFISPWIDRKRNDGKTAANEDLHGFGLESVLPSCYNVQASPPVTSKIANFTDETLFYMFYAMPGDKMQDLAARELTSRNWRYHKELKVWIMLEDPATAQKAMISPDLSGTLPKTPGVIGSGKAPTPISNLLQTKGNALNTYSVFDPQTWTKITKELPIRADQLEDRFLIVPEQKLNVTVK